jgi:hypothetical protein
MKFVFMAFLLSFSTPSRAVENGRPATTALMLELATVSILAKENGALRSDCTGTRIHPRYILTAAHCIYRAKLPFAIRQAINPLDETAALEKIKAVTFPTSSDLFAGSETTIMASEKSDIGLIELEAPSRAPVAQLYLKEKIPTTTQVWQLGYGMDFDPNEHPGREEPSFYPLSFLSNGQLSPWNPRAPTISLVNPGASLLWGDSGSGLFIRDKDGPAKIAGVLSGAGWRNEEQREGFANYASVFLNQAWLRTALNGRGPQPTVVWFTPENGAKLYQQQCSKLAMKLSWPEGGRYDDRVGECLPNDREHCLKLNEGLEEYLYFFDTEQGRCAVIL